MIVITKGIYYERVFSRPEIIKLTEYVLIIFDHTFALVNKLVPEPFLKYNSGDISLSFVPSKEALLSFFQTGRNK